MVSLDSTELLETFWWSPARSAVGATYAESPTAAKWLGTSRFLHRVITPPPDGFEVDHRDRNGLNNMDANLRFASKGQNQANRRKGAASRFKGVTLDSRESLPRRWVAKIQCDGLPIWLGRHASAEEAARAYDEAAVRLFGEFARTNFGRSA